MNLNEFTLKTAAEAVKAKKVSAVELANASLAAIEANGDLNAFITVTPEKALEMARAVDDGKAGGALAGVPVGVKDLYCTKGVRTTAASKILENFVPPYESFVTQKLFGEGAVMVGKTNLDEFAMGGSNLTSYFGPVKNPLDKTKVPGGSSGGSAAAVAGGLCLGAIGTDTGGSIRQPAAFCGIVGVKTTYSRCSRYGIIAMTSSLDTAGPMNINVEDAAIMLKAIAGHDPHDSTCDPRPVPNYPEAVGQSVKGLKIGIPKEYRLDGVSAEINAMWDNGAEILKESGCGVKEVSMPHTKYALPVYYSICPAEVSANLARYDGVRYGFNAEGATLDETYANTKSAAFGKEAQRRLCLGAYILSAEGYKRYFEKALRVRRLVADDFYGALNDVDALLVPTAPSAAFGPDEKQDPVSMYLADIFTIPPSLAGVPGISVPGGKDKAGLPLGLQIIGRKFDEYTLFKLAAVLEGGCK